MVSTGMACLGPEDVFSRWLTPAGGELSGTGEGWTQDTGTAGLLFLST